MFILHIRTYADFTLDTVSRFTARLVPKKLNFVQKGHWKWVTKNTISWVSTGVRVPDTNKPSVFGMVSLKRAEILKTKFWQFSSTRSVIQFKLLPEGKLWIKNIYYASYGVYAVCGRTFHGLCTTIINLSFCNSSLPKLNECHRQSAILIWYGPVWHFPVPETKITIYRKASWVNWGHKKKFAEGYTWRIGQALT